MKRIYKHVDLPDSFVASSVEEAIEMFREWTDKTIGLEGPDFEDLIRYKPFDPECWHSEPDWQIVSLWSEDTGKTRWMPAFLFAFVSPKGLFATGEY